MNLLEHYVLSFMQEIDITDIYERNMKRWYPDYQVTEPVYQVSMRVNCYGVEERVTKIFKKSELEECKAKGYYMA